MINVHFIIHEAFEAPGAYERWAKEKGYGVSYSRVYKGEPLPRNADDLDILIVMGGPQNPATTLEECPYFDAGKEIDVVRKFLSQNKPVIGVCLGSQLLGEAFGAKFENSPYKEIGSYPITLTEESLSNEMFGHFPKNVTVGHWHGDMPGLLPESKVLAYSQGCPRQIVQYSEMAYGFQCHMEFTPEVVDLLIEASQEELEDLAGGEFIQSPEELRENNYTEMNELLYGFLDRLAEKYFSNL
jgi:GMP synthase (glutamine-hydrolysing)